MYSLNVPVPGRVKRLAADLHPQLVPFEQVRADHTLVAKRLGDPDPGDHAAIEGRVRRVLAGTGPFTARVDGIGLFEDPPAGPGPVVYLAVESPGLSAAHERLCDALGGVDGLEGEEYIPHVTLAREGRIETARALADRDVEPVEWTVSELTFFTNRRGGYGGRVSLPA